MKSDYFIVTGQGVEDLSIAVNSALESGAELVGGPFRVNDLIVGQALMRTQSTIPPLEMAAEREEQLGSATTRTIVSGVAPATTGAVTA